MLKELYINNYRRFVDTTVEFGDTVLLAGKNGTGKTTLIELLNKLKQFIVNQGVAGELENLMSINDIPRWLFEEKKAIETEFRFIYSVGSWGTYEYSLILKTNLEKSEIEIRSEKLSIDAGCLYESNLTEDEASASDDNGVLNSFKIDWNHSGLQVSSRVNSKIKAFIGAISGNFQVFSIEPELILPSYHHQNRFKDAQLDIYGRNFNKWYGYMLTQQISLAADVLSSYKDFLPNAANSYIDRDTDEFMIQEFSDNEGGSFDIAFSELSAGQKKLCIYYAIFKMLPSGSTLIFDEFENHLSPGELQPLYDLAQDQQEEMDIQLIIVSHHEKTLNWYHDCSLVFSLEGIPSHIKVEAFDPGRAGTTLTHYLEEE